MKKIELYAWALLVVMIFQLISPTASLALTGGPSQPEFQSFTPIGTTEMVNLPSGGFTYNIPLMDVGGYPLNLAYNSGITADMEASCVGLGWTINPGVINRSVRAIPDDFSGSKDAIVKEQNIRKNVTVGLNVSSSIELFGKETKLAKIGLQKASLNLGVTLNNYMGMGYEFGLTPTFDASKKLGLPLTAKAGIGLSSQNGMNFNPSVGLNLAKEGKSKNDKDKGVTTSPSLYGSLSLGLNVNSRVGLKSFSISASVTDDTDFEKKDQEGNVTEGSWSAGTSVSASYSYATKAYSPSIQMPMNGNSLTLNVKPLPAVALFGSNTAASFSGYVSEQHLAQKTVSKNPYGMLYARSGMSEDKALLDFNREKDGMYNDYDVNLPIVNAGYDVLSVQGQGIGGSFQLKRSDVPMFHDTKSTSVSRGASLGIEMGTPGIMHGGVDIAANRHKSVSGKWTEANDVLNKYDFQSEAYTPYEAAYFKKAGELSIDSDPGFYTDLGEEKAVRADLHEGGIFDFTVESEDHLMNEHGDPVTPASVVKRKHRERRSQVISYKSAKQASKVGLETEIQSYELNVFNTQPDTEDRVNDDRKAHHLSEIESVRPDGLRYVYGIPAYNCHQEETTFNVNASGNAVGCKTGKVVYTSGGNNPDNSVDNKNGKDHYYNSTKTPAYAHSYLLTAVLSQDYEDRLEDGLSEDDYGSYTQINYTKPSPDIYKWRVPFAKDSANYNRGLISEDDDDKGSYLYGEKEIWLVHSIESKTMVAEFHYEERFDAWGVENRNGGFPVDPDVKNHNRKLTKITLYSKPDRRQNGSNATPIKTVHLNYNYSLCAEVPNSKHHATENPNKGKLTLHEVSFTYGHSKKGKLSTYEFNYKHENTSSFTLPYDMKSYDRWGAYKENTHNDFCNYIAFGDSISNDERPYAEQNSSKANDEAGAWSLNKIKLPSGGEINVEYEAKHYAYVQDRHAMRMIDIAGFGPAVSSASAPGSNSLYTVGLDAVTNNNRLYFHLDSDVTTSTKEQLKRQYLKGVTLNKTYLNLRCFVAMTSKTQRGAPMEYISLYAQISGYGIKTTGGVTYGYVDLVELPKDSPTQLDLNPITKFSLQFLREFLPKYAYDQDPVTPAEFILNPVAKVKPVISMLKQMATAIVGFNRVMALRGYCRKIDLTRSSIRLTDPDQKKYGGGSMVRSVIISDNWNEMVTGGKNSIYGQEYEYTIENDRGEPMSSGVASYEPAIGGEENPFKEPVVLTEDRKWAIDNVHYVEKPYCESLMPSPQVVFSEIKVKNVTSPPINSNVDLSRNGTGYSIQKYYTAKDFPVQVRTTDLQKVPKEIKPIFKLLMVKTKDHMNASQGFVIEKNNMHGQAESKEVYDNNNSLISSVKYLYKKKGNQLVNKATVVNSDGTVKEDQLIGVDYHLSGDVRHSQSDSFNAGAAVNLDGFFAGIFPAAIPMILPKYEGHQTRYRSVSMTKVIERIGILEKTVAWDLGSEIATENLAWDAETGEVLITKTYNEFNDPVYNTKLPAHLYYEGMQGAYQNIGLVSDITHETDGIFKCANAEYHMPGDEVIVADDSGSIHGKAWVLHIDDTAQKKIYLIDREGDPFGGSAYTKIKVIRSGHRNMPTSSIGTVTTKNNPIVDNRLIFNDSCRDQGDSLKVLNAQAVEYSDEWQTYCVDCDELSEYEGGNEVVNPPFGASLLSPTEEGVVNPFVKNIRGNWKPEKTWLQLQERNRDALNGVASNTYIRNNGFYEEFTPFWDWTQQVGNPCMYSSDVKIDSANWTWTSEVTKFNPNGMELENKDKLNRYSSEILGFYDQLVTGVAANSRYQQMAFDGFEDYYYNQDLDSNDCRTIPRHFYGIDIAHITDTCYHTGRYALSVPANDSRYTRIELPEIAMADLDYVDNDGVIPDQIFPVELPVSYENPPLTPYVKSSEDCVGLFSPKSGRYVVSAWVREGDGLGSVNYSNHELSISLINSQSASNVVFRAKGKVIDGWQRIEGYIEIQPGDTDLDIAFKSTGNEGVCFDDFRMFPFDGDMKCYVYDDVSLKLLSELDGNGYATIYEYDMSGELIRIKKETERGKMTINESRSAQPK